MAGEMTPEGAYVADGLDDPRLLAALEENAAYADAAAVEALQGEVYRGPEMTRFFSGLPVGQFNGVACARLQPHTADAVIAETVERYIASATPMTWTVGPTSQPPDLGARLEAHGLRLAREQPEMALELAALQPAPFLPSLTISQVTSESQLDQFTDVLVRGFDFSLEATPIARQITASVCFPPDPRWRVYLALLDGQPVATANLVFYAGVAGIYTVSTLPEARGRGIGGAITSHALLRARDLGYRVAALGASEMGYPVYLRLGFQIRATFATYEWTPPARADDSQREGAV